MTKTVKQALMEVLNEDDADAVLEHRRVTIKKPLTIRAAQNLARQFAMIDDPTAGVDMMIDKCWQGFKADWYYNNQSTQRMSSGTRMLLEQHNQQKRLN